MPTLREYQARAVDAVFREWETKQSTIVLAATGTGKTCCFSEIIKRVQPKRTIVIAERREIIYQAKEKIEWWSGIPCEVEMGDSVAATSLFHKTPVVIATIQTLRSGGQSKRLFRFKPEDFDYVIIDECHHAAADSYMATVDYFRRNPSCKIAGFTATGDRADQKALGQIFESVAFKYDILDAVEDGWLVDVTQQFCRVTSLDFSHVHTVAGDLAQNELAAVMESEKNIQGVCQPSLEVMFGLEPKTLSAIEPPKWGEFLSSKVDASKGIPRRSIMFTASVIQAEMCCNIFNRVIPNIAEWVCGKTATDKRKAILGRFKGGYTPIVMNCGVLTEGFDDPYVHCIFMAHPTKSRSKYTQMVGRSTRPLPGIVDALPTVKERLQGISTSQKPFCRIVDFVGNCGRHKLVTALDILGGKATERAVVRALTDAVKEGKPFRVCRKLTNTEAQIEKESREFARKLREAEEARKAKLYAKSEFTQRNVDAFGNGESGPAQRWLGGRNRPLTEKMRRVLLRRGYNPDKYNFYQAVFIVKSIAKKENWKERTTHGTT